MDLFAFSPPHPDYDVSLQFLFPLLLRISYELIGGSLFLLPQSFFIARSSPQPVPSPAATDAANIVQTFPPTRAAAVSPLHSSCKRFAVPPAAHAPSQHLSTLANASKQK